ncbi:MAG: hypothetical protein ACREBI_10910 [Nitrosotalea sp.]
MQSINRLVIVVVFNMSMHQKGYGVEENKIMANVSAVIDAPTAVLIATKFLQQHHSILSTDTRLDEGQWLVTARTGFLQDQVKKVIIDAKTGKIIDCI